MKKKTFILLILLILSLTNLAYALSEEDFTKLIQDFGKQGPQKISILDLPENEIKLLAQEDYHIIGFANLDNNLRIQRENQSEDITVYYVEPGDSLYLIAVRYGLTVNKLKQANNLKSNEIFIGQKLTIPSTDSDKSKDMLYTVQPGDTLFLIAKKYGISVNEIKRENDLQIDVIYIGQKLFIPLTDYNEDEQPEKGGKVLYYVQPGDSLYLLAKRFNVTAGEIRELNKLSSDNLYVGQFLYIPSTFDREDQLIYFVQPGDSLYLIARKFNTTVNNIRINNNLASDILYRGQKLYIKISGTVNKNYNIILNYHVKAGDTLLNIARRFNLNAWEIRAYNGLKSNILHAGQILKLPFAVSGEYLSDSYQVTTGEMELLARAVYSEARGEPFAGQVAVAAVIFNRVKHPFFPDNINDVIFQPWQFSAVHDGQFWLTPDETSYLAAQAAVKGWDPSKGALYYYNPHTAESRWVYYRNVIIEIGNHYFAV